MKLKSILAISLCVCLTISSFVCYKKREMIHLFYKIHSHPPQWAAQQIQSDFSEFSSKITLSSIDETFRKTRNGFLVYRYRIIDGQIFRIGEEEPLRRAFTFEKMLRRIQRSTSLPNVDFLICMMDGVPEVYVPNDFWIAENKERQAPLLAWAKKENARHIVLIPDILTTIEYSWDREIGIISERMRSIPWEKRQNIAFWRGGTTDKGYTLENYQTKPRFLISCLSHEFPQYVDAGLGRPKQEDLAELLNRSNAIKNFASIADHLQYKYLPVLDGWMCTYPGYQWRLLSGSVPFKQESDEMQYYYPQLKPFVHYVPIKNDMSDLIEKVKWAIQHDSECKTIAQNARSFALENLMPDDIYAYLYRVLKKYASLQAFDVRDKLEETQNNPLWQRIPGA